MRRLKIKKEVDYIYSLIKSLENYRTVLDTVEFKLLSTMRESLAMIEAFAAEEPDVLTKTEQEILNCIVAGLSNKEIADKMCVSDKTTKFHITHIYKKMNVTTRGQLIANFYITENEKLKKELEAASGRS